jgi:hypothetical protein
MRAPEPAASVDESDRGEHRHLVVRLGGVVLHNISEFGLLFEALTKRARSWQRRRLQNLHGRMGSRSPVRRYPQLIEPSPPTMHPYPRAIPTEGPHRPSRQRDHALASLGPFAPLAASARCAGATMHPDDAVLRRISTTLCRTVTILRPATATFARFGPTFPPVRPDHASHPRDGALESPIVRRADATMRLHSPAPPSRRPAVRSKGTGHARQGCRWSRLSPGPVCGLT